MCHLQHLENCFSKRILSNVRALDEIDQQTVLIVCLSSEKPGEMGTDLALLGQRSLLIPAARTVCDSLKSLPLCKVQM